MMDIQIAKKLIQVKLNRIDQAKTLQQTLYRELECLNRQLKQIQEELERKIGEIRNRQQERKNGMFNGEINGTQWEDRDRLIEISKEELIKVNNKLESKKKEITDVEIKLIQIRQAIIRQQCSIDISKDQLKALMLQKENLRETALEEELNDRYHLKVAS